MLWLSSASGVGGWELIRVRTIRHSAWLSGPQKRVGPAGNCPTDLLVLGVKESRSTSRQLSLEVGGVDLAAVEFEE